MHAPLALRCRLAQIGAPFGSKNAIFVPGEADWSCLGLEFVRGIQYRQIYSYNGKIEVGPNSA